MEKKMNAFLADLVVESHKLQTYHWYVKGPDFFQAHLQLEEYYNLVNTLIDEVAETMLMCDMKPLATCEDFIEASDIKEAQAEFVTSKVAFSHTAKDFEHLLEFAKKLKAKAEKDGYDLISIKADTFIETFSKPVWMLKQH